MIVDIVRHAINYLEKACGPTSRSRKDSAVSKLGEVVGVWMTADEGCEEKDEAKEVQRLVEDKGKQFRLFPDEKYYVDEYNSPF
jgi:hypothetical protein